MQQQENGRDFKSLAVKQPHSDRIIDNGIYEYS